VWRWHLVVTLVALVAAGRAQGQAIADLPAGARVRITLPDSARPFPFARRARAVIGTVARATMDTLWVQVGGPDTVRVPRGVIRKVEVSRGVSRARSALEMGLLFGVDVGLLVATHDHHERGEAVAIGVSAVALGAFIGAVSPYERWRRVR